MVYDSPHAFAKRRKNSHGYDHHFEEWEISLTLFNNQGLFLDIYWQKYKNIKVDGSCKSQL